MPVDKWGHPFFYPTKTSAGVTGSGTAWFVQQSNDIRKDSWFDGSGDITNVNTTSGSWTVHFSGPTSVAFGRHNDTFTDSIDGCNMDFSRTALRGYAYKSDDPRDVEIKFLMRVTKGSSDSGLSIGGPTGHHTSSECCQGFAYMINVQYAVNPALFRFRKEMWHVSYHTDPDTGDWTSPTVNFKLLGHGWVGYSFVRYNKHRDNNTDSVICECWFNPIPETDPTAWTMLKRTEDNGGWGDDGGKCNGNKDQIGTWSNARFRIKSNDSDGDIEFKHLSIREIDPTGTFALPPPDPNPTPDPTQQPGPTQVQGNFGLVWTLNSITGVGACSGSGTPSGTGTDPTTSIFYDIAATHETELSNSTTFQNRTRVGQSIDNSSSLLYDTLIKQIDIPLHKVGTPAATPVLRMKIYNSSNIIVYQSPTDLDPSTLTGSFAYYTFDFSTNTHRLRSGDKVAIQWDGTSDVNYVICGYGDNVRANSTYVNYESGVWEYKPTTRDMAFRWWG